MSLLESELTMINEVLLKQNQFVESLIELGARTSQPPMKGKITKEKMTWRGIRLIEKRNENGSTEYFIKQRNVTLTPTLSISAPRMDAETKKVIFTVNFDPKELLEKFSI